MKECRPTLLKAREIMDQKNQRQQTYQSTFTLDRQEFIEKRLIKVEDALLIEKANQCQAKCQQPTDILKRILQSNLKEVSNNIQNCTRTAQGIDQQTGMSTVDYDRAEECLKKNLEIL